MLRPTPLLLLSLLVSAGAVPAGELVGSKNLFFIKRNKNANEVHYDARLQNCAWSDHAVDYYWRDLQKGPKVTSEIMPWEPPAYGFKVSRSTDSEITIVLNALPEKELKARISKTADGGCSVLSTIEIGGKTADLSSVYINAEEKTLLGIPVGATVHYILILGISQDGPVFERIVKTRQGASLASSPPHPSLWKSGAASFGRP